MTTQEAQRSFIGPDVDYALYDADQHYYEPHDALTRHLDPKYRHVVKWMTIDGGRRSLLINGQQVTVVPNPTYDPVGVPGSMEAYFRAENHDAKEMRDIMKMHPIPAEAREREARLARLDQQGVEQTWLIPSLGLGIEEMLQEDPESAMAVFTAYNKWLADDWGYDRDGRIMTGPMISFLDPALAEQELDRVLEIGTRMIIMRAGPVASPHTKRPSPADKRFDRIWAKLAEAGTVVAIHAGDAGYNKYLGDWGEPTRYTGMKASPLTEVLSVAIERPIYDMMAAMICHGLFDRHPTLKVATLELGAAWVPELHRRLRITYGKTPQLFGRDPVESFREHVWVAPFYEDNIATIRDIHGADRILLGSDWPHPEGLSEPRAWIGDFVDLGEADMRKALRDNQKALTGH
jgi:predicted TIM-barrel fold metal-dependent hydrolase